MESHWTSRVLSGRVGTTAGCRSAGSGHNAKHPNDRNSDQADCPGGTDARECPIVVRPGTSGAAGSLRGAVSGEEHMREHRGDGESDEQAGRRASTTDQKRSKKEPPIPDTNTSE